MKKLIGVIILGVTIFVGTSLFAQAPQNKHGCMLEAVFDCQRVEYTDVDATGCIDVDESGFFLDIADSKDRVYFQNDAVGIKELYANKRFVHMVAEVHQGDRGLYYADSFGLRHLD